MVYLLHFRRPKALIFQIAVRKLIKTARILLAAHSGGSSAFQNAPWKYTMASQKQTLCWHDSTSSGTIPQPHSLRAHQHGAAPRHPRKVRQSRAAVSLWGRAGQIGRNVMTLKLTSRCISFYCFIHTSVHTHTNEFWRLVLKRATALVCTKGGSAKSDCLRRWENIRVSPATRTTSSFNKDGWYCFHWWTASKSNY